MTGLIFACVFLMRLLSCCSRSDRRGRVKPPKARLRRALIFILLRVIDTHFPLFQRPNVVPVLGLMPRACNFSFQAAAANIDGPSTPDFFPPVLGRAVAIVRRKGLRDDDDECPLAILLRLATRPRITP